MVRIHPDPPEFAGAVAQLGEHLLCKQGVVGSIPSSSTNPGVTSSCFTIDCAMLYGIWIVVPRLKDQALDRCTAL